MNSKKSKKGLLLHFALILLCISFYSCETSRIVSLSDIYEKKVLDTIYLQSGTYQLDKQILIESGTFIKGKNTTILFDPAAKKSVIKFNHVRNCGFSGIKFKGTNLINNKTKDELEAFNFKYVIEVNESDGIKIENCVFENSYGTVIKILDSNNIDIYDSEINTVGFPTNSKMVYSYDGIFIGGYKESKNINISRCIFKNIGSTFPSGNLPWPNDGDGIHIQSAGNVENVIMTNNRFEACSARGIKVQSGKNLIIEDSKFLDCRSAVIITMAHDVSNISIKDNTITNSVITFGSGGSNKVVSGLKLIGNKVNKCEHFFRTSETSNVANSTIANNQINEIETYFILGRFMNTKIVNNTIEKYASKDNKSYNFCMYVSPESNDVTIKDNYFGKSKADNREIVLKSKNKVNVSQNTFKQRNK